MRAARKTNNKIEDDVGSGAVSKSKAASSQQGPPNEYVYNPDSRAPHANKVYWIRHNQETLQPAYLKVLCLAKHEFHGRPIMHFQTNQHYQAILDNRMEVSKKKKKPVACRRDRGDAPCHNLPSDSAQSAEELGRGERPCRSPTPARVRSSAVDHSSRRQRATQRSVCAFRCTRK